VEVSVDCGPIEPSEDSAKPSAAALPNLKRTPDPNLDWILTPVSIPNIKNCGRIGLDLRLKKGAKTAKSDYLLAL
jgi:hypothetical protein